MKLISLNVWGGNAGDCVIDFFRKNQDVDAFLLQEVFHHATEITHWNGKGRPELFSEIGNALPDHQGYFAPSESGEWGPAIFIKKSIAVREAGDVFVHRWKDALVGRDGATLGRNMQYLKIDHGGTDLLVVNFHGLWNGKGKTDTDERIRQSENVRSALKKLNAETVLLAGDFNILPDTQSFAILKDGMRDLVAEFNIVSTRSPLYGKDIRMANYVLVSPSVRVKNFKVLEDVVSDHLPLFAEFD